MKHSCVCCKIELGRWRLIQDIHAINKTIHVWVTPERGLLHFSDIPVYVPAMTIDIKVWYFSSTSHIQDCEYFVISILPIYSSGPALQQEWNILIRDMANTFPGGSGDCIKTLLVTILAPVTKQSAQPGMQRTPE